MDIYEVDKDGYIYNITSYRKKVGQVTSDGYVYKFSYGDERNREKIGQVTSDSWVEKFRYGNEYSREKVGQVTSEGDVYKYGRELSRGKIGQVTSDGILYVIHLRSINFEEEEIGREKAGQVSSGATMQQAIALLLFVEIPKVMHERIEFGNCPKCQRANLNYMGKKFDILPTPMGTNWPSVPRNLKVFKCPNCGYTKQEPV